jgi:hypothetical protein
MAQYFTPPQVKDGYFVTPQFWNRLYGESGSLVYLYDNYELRTRYYHLKLSKNDFEGMTTSWANITSWSRLQNNIVTWNTTLIDEFPEESASLWNNDEEQPNSLTIIESGYYLIHVHLNIFNYVNRSGGILYVHLVRESQEDSTLTTIATDYIYNTTAELDSLGYPTWADRRIIRPVNLQCVYWLESDDILYVIVQPYLPSGTGNTTFSFIPKNYTRVPTEYITSFTKGATSFVTSGIKTSFISAPYIGMSPSFFEIQSIRLEQ